MQHVHHVGSADGLRIVHASFVKSEVLTQLLGTFLGDVLHIVLSAKFQAPGRTCFDARRLQSLSNAVRAQRALVYLLRRWIELRNIEWASRDAELAADAILLLEIDDAVRVLHYRTIGRTRAQAAGIGAVHALILAHEPLYGTVFARMFVELDQVPEIPARLRHRLVGVVEHGRSERHVVPLDARHLAGLAADADGRIDQFADLGVALHAISWRVPGVARYLLDLKCFAVAHAGSLTFLHFFDLHQKSLELGRVRIRIDHRRR